MRVVKGDFKMNLIKRINLNFTENKFFYLIVLSFFFIGILMGSYTIKYMEGIDSTDLSNYFTEFIKSLNGGEVKNKELFINIIKNNFILIFLIIALGFTFFGAPIILIVDLIKGFTLGYTFTFLLTTFEGEGIWIALSTTIPQNIFYIPFFIGISILAIEISIKRFKSKILNVQATSKLIARKIITKYSFLILLFFIGVMIECFISPGLIKLIVTKVYKLT